MAEKRKGRRAYLNDFKKNEQGQYEYGGRRYSYRGDDLGRRRMRTALLCALMIVLMAVAGCVDVPGMRGCFYVLLPYAAGLAAAAGVCLAVYRFCTGGDPMKEYVYEASVPKIPGRALFSAVCAGLTASGEAFFALQNGLAGKTAGFALFLLLEAAAAVLALFLWRDARGNVWI